MKFRLSLHTLCLLAGAAFMITMASCSNNPSRKIKSGKELFTAFYKPYHDEADGASLRGERKAANANLKLDEDEDLLEMRNSAISAYSQSNYSQAIILFEKYLEARPNDQVVLFYAGSSYLGIDNADKALNKFEKILGNTDAVFYNHTEWYTALIYVEKENYAKAKEILDKIIANPDHYYYSTALALSDEVNYNIANAKK